MATNADLQHLIDNAPDNSVLTVPAGTYTQTPTDTITFSARNGLVLEGNGVILRRDEYVTSVGGTPNRQLDILDSVGITLHGLTIKGPKPDSMGYEIDYEAQHNVCISGGGDARVLNCVLQRAMGDHVYVAAGTSRVTITGNTMNQCGRHGISINSASNVLINANTTNESHRWSVSFERNIPTDQIVNVICAYNTFKNPNVGFINGEDQVSGTAIFAPNVTVSTD